MMTVRIRGACILAALLAGAVASSRAAAEVPGTIDMAAAPAALTRLFQAQTAKPEWFTPAFLEEVPVQQVNTVLAGVTQQYGAFKSVDGNGMDYVVHLARGSVHVRVVVDHTGLIAGLLVTP